MNKHQMAIEKFRKTIELEKELRHPDLEEDKKYLEIYIQNIQNIDLDSDFYCLL